MNYNELENIFLLHELGMFYQRTGQSPSDKYKNLSESELGCTHSKWSATLAGELGLSGQVQDVILYHHKPEILNDENAIVANILNLLSAHLKTVIIVFKLNQFPAVGLHKVISLLQ